VFFNYRYAIYRAGVFHRWEEPSEIDGDDVDEQLSHQDNNEADSSNNNVHQIPLHLFNAGELYTVNDVLGFTVGPPDIDHIKIRQQMSSVSSLARKNAISAASLYGIRSSPIPP